MLLSIFSTYNTPQYNNFITVVHRHVINIMKILPQVGVGNLHELKSSTSIIVINFVSVIYDFVYIHVSYVNIVTK